MRRKPLKPLARFALACAAGLTSVCTAFQSPAYASQADFLSRPVNMILPFPAGSTSDTIARILQTKLTEKLGVSVVVENKPGASGDIAFSLVARSEPDGHTLLLTPDAIVVNPILKGKGVEEVFDKLRPVTVVAEAPLAFILSPALPTNNFQDFVAYAKARPNELNFGSSGVGSIPYLSAAYFMQLTGTQMVHVPYRGAAQSMNAAFTDEIQFFLGDVSRYIAFQDRLKALAVTGPQRDPRLPDVPTLAESTGNPQATFGLWLTAFLPKDTPAELVQRWNDEISAVMASPDFQELMKTNGYSSTVRTPAETEKFIRDGYDFWHKIVVDGKLTFEP